MIVGDLLGESKERAAGVGEKEIRVGAGGPTPGKPVLARISGGSPVGGRRVGRGFHGSGMRRGNHLHSKRYQKILIGDIVLLLARMGASELNGDL